MSVKAKATITVEIDCNSTWDEKTTINQVRKQACDDAIGFLNRLQAEHRGKFIVVGKPSINIISFNAGEQS